MFNLIHVDYWNWISKYGAVFILNFKKIDKIKKKKIHSVFVMYSCILYTVHVFQKFSWRGIWFGFPHFWQQLFLSWRFQSLLSSVCFTEVRPADPTCSKTIGFYYPTKLISWSRKKLAFYQSIKTLFPLSTDSFYVQVSDSCPEIFAYCT